MEGIFGVSVDQGSAAKKRTNSAGSDKVARVTMYNTPSRRKVEYIRKRIEDLALTVL